MTLDQRSTHSARGLATLALLLYVVLGVVLLLPAILGDDVVSPAAFWAQRGPFPEAQRVRVPDGINVLSDNVTQFTPWLRYAADALAQDGRLPLWKSLSLCGAPLVGNGQSALFFPTNLLAVALGAPPWIGVAQSLLKLVIGAFGAYLLGRHLRMSFLGSLLAGLIFGFGGFQVLFLQHPHTHVSMLLPLLLLCADRAAQQPGYGRLAVLAVVCGLQHLAGHPETTLHCQLAAAALVVARVWSLRASAPHPLRRLLAVAGAFVLGALLGAIQILPVLEYIGESDALRLRALRAATAAPPPLAIMLGCVAALAVAILCAVHLARGRRLLWLSAAGLLAAVMAGLLMGLEGKLSETWITLASSDWYGKVGRYIGPANYVEQNGAFAGAALPLALLGLLSGRPRGAMRAGGVLLLVGVLALLRAPGVDDLLHVLPGLRLAENARLSVLALLATAMLAGAGLDAVGRAARVPLGVPTARLRYGLLCGCLLLGGWGALAWGVTDGSIDNPNVPEATAAFPVRALAVSEVKGLLPAPIVTQLSRLVPLAGEPLKYFAGWFVTPPNGRATPADVSSARLLYGKFGFSVEALLAPALQNGDPATPWLTQQGEPIHVFLAIVPEREFPPEISRVRLRVALTDGFVAVSKPLTAPDDPGTRVLPFPAQPTSRLALIQPLLLVLVAGLALALLAARGTLREGGRVVLVLLCGTALLPFTAGMLPLLPERCFYPASGALDALRAIGSDARMLAMDRGAMPAEIPVYYGIRDVRGYDALYPRRTARLLRQALDYPPWVASMEALPVRTDIDLRVLGLMAVRGIADWREAPADMQRLHFRDESLLPQWAPFRIVRNPQWLPRARLVTGCVIEPDDEAAVSTLFAPDFPLETTAVLASGTPRAASPEPAGEVHMGADRPDLVRVLIDPKQSCHLVLADTHFPGWVAFVDGKPREIERANLAFRAVAVEPGEHVVEFRYEPVWVRVGALGSAAGALLVLVLGGLEWRSRRRPGDRSSPAA